jgi:hypothetical protein
MYFEDFKMHPTAKLNPKLLWEQDLSDFDFKLNRNLVVQRVIERGWPMDWYISHQFAIPQSSMKCCEKKQLANQHWNS